MSEMTTERQDPIAVVERALARGNVTRADKRRLNGLLGGVVIRVQHHAYTGEEMRIGLNAQERAAKLGVHPNTIKEWDKADRSSDAPLRDDAPTHRRRTGWNEDKPYPVRNRRSGGVPTEQPRREARPTREAVRPKRGAPAWKRYFTIWCRGVLPEDRVYLLSMSDELHEALGRLDLSCGHEKEARE